MGRADRVRNSLETLNVTHPRTGVLLMKPWPHPSDDVPMPGKLEIAAVKVMVIGSVAALLISLLAAAAR